MKQIIMLSLLSLTVMISSCKKDDIRGCTDPNAVNYNPNATEDDGFCVINGCTNPAADNYNPAANNDNGSCIISGCTNPAATNYNPNANNDDGSCQIPGCTDPEAINFNPEANIPANETCMYKKDVFLGTYVGKLECEDPIAAQIFGNQEVTFQIVEVPGSNDEVTVTVGLNIPGVDQPKGEIDDDLNLTFAIEQKGLEINIGGVPQTVDISVTGDLQIDEATMTMLTGPMIIKVKNSQFGIVLLESICQVNALRQ